MSKIRALSAWIYKYKGESFSNHGISEKFNEILFACPDGHIELDTDNLPENFCNLVKRELFGEPHWYFEPKTLSDSGKWTMFGGCYVHSSDTRFREIAQSWLPIQLFDRVE